MALLKEANIEDQKFGLCYYIEKNDNEAPICVPFVVQSVSVVASVVHIAARIEIKQEYVNKEKQALECVYTFPTESIGAVVTHFLVKIEERTLQGSIKSYEDAKKQYIKALEKHRTQSLSEEDSLSKTFRIDIGTVQPDEKISVTLHYITEAKNEEPDSIRFFIPKAIVPINGIPPEIVADTNETAVTEAVSATTAGKPTRNGEVTIKVGISMQGTIDKIQCPSHNANISKVETSTGKIVWTQVIVNVRGKIADMNRDFVLIVTPIEGDKPRLYSEKIDEDDVAVMTHLIPKLEQEVEKLEILILLDRSGSMEGTRMQLAQTAIRMLLHSLPAEGVYFNIVGFGTTYNFLFPESVVYNEENLSKAEKYVKNLRGDLGGTELIEVLKVIYEQSPVEGHLRQLFVVTDGEVISTMNQVISLIHDNAHHTRVFSLGIGKNVSPLLVRGIAEAGNGTFHFVKDNEQMDVKILDQLKTALLPSFKDIYVHWDGTEYISRENYYQAPSQVPPITNGFPLIIFGIFSSEDKPSGISISGESSKEMISYKMPLDSERQVGTKNVVSALAAVKVIKELESQDLNEELNNSADIKEEFKQKIINLSTKYGIISKYTTFVLLNEDLARRASSHSSHTRMIQQKLIPTDAMKLWSKSNSCKKSCSEASACCSRFKKEEIKFPGFPKIPTFDEDGCRGFPYGPCTLPGFPLKTFGSIINQMNMPEDVESTVPSNIGLSIALSKDHSKNRGFVSTGALLQENADIDDFRQELTKDSFRNDLAAAMMNMSKEDFFANSQTQFGQSVAAKEEPISPAMNQVHRIAFLQSSSGYFTFSQKFCDALSLELDLIKIVLNKHQWDETAMATVLAIVFFAEKIPEQKKSWELISLKAKKCLLKNHSEMLDDMIGTAQTLLLVELDSGLYEKITQFSKHY